MTVRALCCEPRSLELLLYINHPHLTDEEPEAPWGGGTLSRAYKMSHDGAPCAPLAASISTAETFPVESGRSLLPPAPGPLHMPIPPLLMLQLSGYVSVAPE